MELIKLENTPEKSKGHLLNRYEKRLIKTIQRGLPLVSKPYAAVAEELGLDEETVIKTIEKLIEKGYIKRHGIVVRHRDIGYRANAMVVWNIPDDKLGTIPHLMKEFPFVTLCYRRPRKLPEWPYNVFCMIHGRDRATVLNHLEEMTDTCHLHDIPHEVLFSKRRFKQRGAHYIYQHIPETPAAAPG